MPRVNSPAQHNIPAAESPLNLVIDDLRAMDAIILEQLSSDVALVESIGHHLIDAGGKRLRPATLFLAANALGVKGNMQHWLGTCIEFIHTATLLHDDVVDMSDRRRGKATANAKWGNAPSVLVGDFLYSRAFQMLVKTGSLDILGTISDATNVISEGEVQQLANARNANIS